MVYIAWTYQKSHSKPEQTLTKGWELIWGCQTMSKTVKTQFFSGSETCLRSVLQRLAYENDGSLQLLLRYVEYNMELGTYKKVMDSPMVKLPYFYSDLRPEGRNFP